MSDEQDAVVSEEVTKVSPIVPTYGREVGSVFAIGAGVGLVTSLAYFLLEKFVFGAVMCSSADASCKDANTYAMVVAIIIGAILGLVLLVQGRVYRPLLAVLATVVSLWGFDILLVDMAWYWALLVSVLLFGLTYSLFAWIARIRSFVLALIVTVTLVVAARIIMMN